MNLHRLLAALFVSLALAGCAQEIPGQAQAPYAPNSPEDNGIRPEHGGGDGSGGWQYVAAEAQGLRATLEAIRPTER